MSTDIYVPPAHLFMSAADWEAIRAAAEAQGLALWDYLQDTLEHNGPYAMYGKVPHATYENGEWSYHQLGGHRHTGYKFVTLTEDELRVDLNGRAVACLYEWLGHQGYEWPCDPWLYFPEDCLPQTWFDEMTYMLRAQWCCDCDESVEADHVNPPTPQPKWACRFTDD